MKVISTECSLQVHKEMYPSRVLVYITNKLYFEDSFFFFCLYRNSEVYGQDCSLFLMFHAFILVGLKMKGPYVLVCMSSVMNGSKTTLI